MYTLSSEVSGNILLCGHNYHIECLAQANQKCQYCYEYLCNGIKYHCKVFQNMLNRPFNNIIDEDDKDLENQQEDPQEDNDNKIISVKNNIYKKLEEMLKLFKLYQ